METNTTKLTPAQARELREMYGWYKEIKNDDFDSFDEYKDARVESRNEIKAKLNEFGLTDDSFENIEELIYSQNQLQFIEDAQQGNGELHYDYSGRGMYGDCCPALYCDSHNDITTHAKFKTDSMGLGIVIYAQY